MGGRLRGHEGGQIARAARRRVNFFRVLRRGSGEFRKSCGQNACQHGDAPGTEVFLRAGALSCGENERGRALRSAQIAQSAKWPRTFRNFDRFSFF
jgi:hypothetical protein